MPSPTEPLFLLDPDSPRFHHLSEPNEPSAAASPQAASQQRPQVYVLIPHRPNAVASASLDEAVKAAFSIFDSEEWKAVRWNEEDKRHIIELKKALFAIDAANALLGR